MAENKMFCFQCQETAKGTGCTIKGVCGKEATTSKWQDLLLSVVRGIGTIQHSIGKEPTPEVTHFLTDALFTTITNANFNDQDILQKVDKGIVLKKQLLQKAASMNIHLPAYQEVTWGGEKTDYEAEGTRESVLRHVNADIRSLKELTMLGLKGMAAYYEHAAHLGEENSEIISFICRALATISNPDADMNTLLDMVLETGKYGVDVMALLDKANTQAYGNPELTRVNIGTGHPHLRSRPEGYRRSPHPDRRHGHRRLYPWRDASCPLLSAAQEVQASGGQLRQCVVETEGGIRELQRSYSLHHQLHRTAIAISRLQEPRLHHQLYRFPWLEAYPGGCRRPQGLLRGDCACQDLPAT